MNVINYDNMQCNFSIILWALQLYGYVLRQFLAFNRIVVTALAAS